MPNLTVCLKKVGDKLDPADKAAVLNRSRELRSGGMGATEAAKEAVKDVISGIRAELKAAEPKKPVTQPLRVKHPKTVMGSELLAIISDRLGGLDPSLISEYSVYVPTGKLDKKTKAPLMAWRNPMIPGIGLLFRRGGRQDRQEIAQVLEDADYLEPGAVAADYKEAGERAKDLIKAALDRNIPKTLAEQQAEMEADQEAERQAYYDALDEESAREADAERAAIMAEAELSRVEVQAADDDLLLDVAGTSDTATQMRALGFSEQEIADELARESQAQAPVRGEDAQATPGAAPEAGPAGVDAAQRGPEQAAEGLTLEAPTPDSLKARAAREKVAADADAKEQKRLADKAKADAEAPEFTLTGSDRPADVAAAAGQGDIFDTSPESVEKPAASEQVNRFAGNKVFTQSDVDAARALLKKKLGQINSGIDPELMQAGITIAGAYIESGVRKFADFARVMVDDLGDRVKPYLQSWYMAVRADPRAAAFRAEMDKASAIEDLDVDEVLAATPAAVPAAASPAGLVEHVTGKGKTLRGVVRSDLTKAQAQAIDPYTFKKDDGWFIRERHLDDLAAAHPAGAPAPETQTTEAGPSLTQHLLGKIQSGEMPKDNVALKRLVSDFDGAPASQPRMKQAQEALETAIVMTAREVVARKEGPRSTFDMLVRLYESQPNLNVRTSTSIANQAYSTPAPLAFLASELAGIKGKARVHEPTGGNGMLLIGADPSMAFVNELNQDRAASLREQGFEVTTQDAAEGTLITPGSADALVTNPPFGSMKGPDGKPTKVKVDGYSLGQIDHLIAARALAGMKDDGRAVLILGANKMPGGMSNDDLVFFNWLRAHYQVSAQFEVAGDLYTRQGASWPVRVVVIDGRGPSADRNPNAYVQRPSTWAGVYDEFSKALAAERLAAPVVGAQPRGAGQPQPVPQPDRGQTARPDSGRPQGRPSGPGDVAGERAGTVGDRGAAAAEPVGERASPQRSVQQLAANELERGGSPTRADQPAGSPRTSGLTSAENQFQAKYVARSANQDKGVLIPVNMAGPTQDALNRLEDAVGDIDQYLRKELGYSSVQEMHKGLMGLQVDSVASAIFQIQSGKGVVIADQTGIGKGRQAAAVIRWAIRAGHIPVFVTVKPSLFTDMFGDLSDIGSDDVAPFIMNVSESIKGRGDEKLFANKPATHRRTLDRIVATGQLPEGSNALFMTYSQINTPNVQSNAVMALAPRAVFILDESHNAGGDSNTGTLIKGALDIAKGVTYLSATFAKRPDNMPVYFKTDIGEALGDDTSLMDAMTSGGLPLQVVVSNNLVRAGQMFRRERSYDGVNIESRADTAHHAEHVKLSDLTTSALRAIVDADRHFHENHVKELQEQLKKEGARALDIAGNQAQQSVDHTQFSSVVHNFVRQMLLGLKAQAAADEAIASLKRGEKPLIAVENTMGSFLTQYAGDNNIKPGEPLGTFDYRNVLTRALDRTRFIVRQLPNGDKVKEEVKLADLSPTTRAMYDAAQKLIDGLRLDIPVSPIDWMRQEISKAGFTVAEITGRNLSVDYTDPKVPRLDSIDAAEQKDKVATTRAFNSGKLDAIILNVAGSTGISLHASEKFQDQRQRHMIVAQAAQDINIFMQMLGRIHRTGQVALPKYTILNADLPAEKRPTALLSGKMKSLNANTSSNTESATSVKTADMMNKYGDQIVNQFLSDNFDLARALGLDEEVGEADAAEDIARKATGRLALMPVATQEAFYNEIEDQYNALIEYLNKTNQNDLEPRTFDFGARETRQEILFEGQNKASPFGDDAVYGEYSVKAQGRPMTPDEIKALVSENLGGKSPQDHVQSIIDGLKPAFEKWYAGLDTGNQLIANRVSTEAVDFLKSHTIGSAFRLEINGDVYNAVVTNIRNTHKATGNPFSLSKLQVTASVNGALRSVTTAATQFKKIEVANLYMNAMRSSISGMFEAQPANQRETAKIVTGNLLAAYGELGGTRGTIITFTKEDGTDEQGILLPKRFNFAKDVRKDYRFQTAADALKFLSEGTSGDLPRFGIQSRDTNIRVLPNGRGITIQVPKSKAKGGKVFLDQDIIKEVGDFVSVGSYMRASTTDRAAAERALTLLSKKSALYALPSMADEAKALVGDKTGPTPVLSQGRGRGVPLSTLKPNIDAITAKMPGLRAAVEVVATVTDLPPKIVDSLRSMNALGTVRGLRMPDGRVFLVADKLDSQLEAEFVLFHEVYGHEGLRAILTGDEYARAMTLVRLSNKAVAAEADRWTAAYGADQIDARIQAGMSPEAARREVRLLAVEEALADRAGRNDPPAVWKNVMAAIQKALRRMGMDDLANWLENRTEAETYALLMQARKAITEGKPHALKQVPEGMAAMSRRDEPIATAPAVTVQPDENGNPTFRGAKVKLDYPQPAERFEFIPGPGQQLLNYAIMPSEGFDSLGFVELVVENGQVTALLDIEINGAGRRAGVGKQVIETILAANPQADVNISNIVHQARGFWAKMGVPEQNLEDGAAYDGTLNWQTYAEATNDGRAAQVGQGMQGQVRRADAGATGADGEAGRGAQTPVLSQQPPTQGPIATAAQQSLPAQRQPLPAGWRDPTNRLQFAPGQWLYGALGRLAAPLLIKLQFKAATPEMRRQLRQMKLDVQKAQDVAVAVAKETTKLSDAEREMVSDIIEREVKAGTVPPEHAIRLAALMNNAMGEQSRELIRLGMLTPEAAARWDGAYLPRFYESKLKKQVGDAWADAVKRLTGRTSAMKGVKGSHLKSRGIYEPIIARDLEKWEQMGWEIRDPDYPPGTKAADLKSRVDAGLLKPDEQVQMWRDYTRDEREKMGEIRDAGFRFVMGYMQTQRDIALGRMFEKMANDPASSSRIPQEGWVKVPDSTIEGTGAKRYGKLSGRYVPKETLSHLSQIEESQSAAWQMYRSMMSYWKMGKTVLNFVSHMNNVVSNLTNAHFAGVSYHRADKYIAAIKDFATAAPAIKEARDAGLFLGTMSDAELMTTLPKELQELAGQAESKTVKGAKLVFDLMSWGLRKPLSAAYQFEDTFFRYLIYKDGRDQGMSPDDAIDHAQRYIFNYDDLPKGARMVRDFGIPFFAYTYKAVPMLLHTALTHPHRMAAPAAVLMVANAAAYAIAYADDDEDWIEALRKYIESEDRRERINKAQSDERKNLPPWLKGSAWIPGWVDKAAGTNLMPKTIRLGMDELTALPVFMDVSRMIPGGDLADVHPNVQGALPIPQPITPSHPVISIMSGVLANRDLWTGKDLVDLNDTTAESTKKRSMWIWRNLAPAISIGNYHVDRTLSAIAYASGGEIKWLPEIIADDYTGTGKDGLAVQPKYAAMQTIGIKIRPIDLEMSADFEQSKQKQIVRTIEAEMRQIAREEAKGSKHPRAAQRERDKLMEKRARVMDGLTVDGDEKP